MKKSRKCLIAWTVAVMMALTCGAGSAFANDDVQSEEGEVTGEIVSEEAEQPAVGLGNEGATEGENPAEENNGVRLGEGSEETYYNYELEFDSDSQDLTLFDGESITVFAKPVDGTAALPTGYSFQWKVGTYNTEDETTINIDAVEGVTFEPIKNEAYDGIKISTEKGCFDEESLVFLVVEATLTDSEGAYVDSYYNSFAGRCTKASFDLPGDDETLIGGTYYLPKTVWGFIINSENPDGKDIETYITALKVSDESIINVSSDEDAWLLHAISKGATDVTATYLDENGIEREHTFKLSVKDVVYSCITERLTESIVALPGEKVSYETSMYCSKINPETDETVNTTIDDYTVDWDIVQIDNETEERIQKHTVSLSDNGQKLDIAISETSPESYFIIEGTFRIGTDIIEVTTDYLYVEKEVLSAIITDNYGYNEPSLPGDSADYTLEVSWKKFDETSKRVVVMDTSKVNITWEVELYDDDYYEDTTHNISNYVSYKVDADSSVLHFKINDKWIDEDKHVQITATASTGDDGISSSDSRWIDLSKDVDKFETAAYCAEAGSTISLDELKPQAKRYNKDNTTGQVVDEYNFWFSDEYFLEIKDDRLPLEGVTVSKDGKTLTLPKVKDGRYVVCINVEAKNGMFGTSFYAPLNVGHKYKSTITKATNDRNGAVVKECTQCGNKVTETIYSPKTIKLSTTNYTYSGGVKKPAVSVIDADGDTISSSNYNVSYTSGCKSVGRYKAIVTFKGDKYSGSKYTYFNINPKGTSISKVSKAKKAFTVKWKRQSSKMASSRITGYQIRYSTSSKMTGAKTKTVKGYKSTSKKITKLKAKAKYYVQIRTYKTVSGKNYYSSWSGVKSVRTR